MGCVRVWRHTVSVCIIFGMGGSGVGWVWRCGLLCGNVGMSPPASACVRVTRTGRGEFPFRDS